MDNIIVEYWQTDAGWLGMIWSETIKGKDMICWRWTYFLGDTYTVCVR